jgi:hypothetical protein
MLMRALAFLGIAAVLVAIGWALNRAIEGAPNSDVNPIVLVDPGRERVERRDEEGERAGDRTHGGRQGTGNLGEEAPNPRGQAGSSQGPSSGPGVGAPQAPPPPPRPAGDDRGDDVGDDDGEAED